MCSPRAGTPGIIGAALLLACSAQRLHAQDRAELVQRLDALSRTATSANARLRAFDDSLARARRTMQLVSVGPFRMHVQPDLLELATRAAGLAVDQLQWMGGGALERMAKHELVVRSEGVPWGFPRQVIPSVVVAILDTAGVERMPLWGPVDTPQMLASWLRQEATQALARDLDRTFDNWLGGIAVFDTLATGSWIQLRLQLVSSPATISRRCYAQDIPACLKLLGLTPTADPAREWFDAKARRALVEREKRTSYRRVGVALTDACLAGGDAACLRVLETGEIGLYTFLPGHRVSLLQHAIQLGGPGAVARLYATGRTPTEHLEDVARLPVDSLVSSWARRVRDTRVPSENLTPGISVVSLAWIGIFGALALRSSRWR